MSTNEEVESPAVAPEQFAPHPTPAPELARMVCSYCKVERGGPGQRSPRFCPADPSPNHWHNFVDPK